MKITKRKLALRVLVAIQVFGMAVNTCTAQQVAKGATSIRNQHGVSPQSPLTARVAAPLPPVLEKFYAVGMNPVEHRLTRKEADKVKRALAKLPPLHLRILKEHLASISFLDNMPNNALTTTLDSNDGFRIFNITVRAEILKQDVSQWLTAKEITCFVNGNKAYRVSIEAGHLDAIDYVLLHEATHVVDCTLDLMPRSDKPVGFENNPFTSGIWIQRTLLSTQYQNELLGNIRFVGGKAVPSDMAVPIYGSLSKTPLYRCMHSIVSTKILLNTCRYITLPNGCISHSGLS